MPPLHSKEEPLERKGQLNDRESWCALSSISVNKRKFFRFIRRVPLTFSVSVLPDSINHFGLACQRRQGADDEQARRRMRKSRILARLMEFQFLIRQFPVGVANSPAGGVLREACGVRRLVRLVGAIRRGQEPPRPDPGPKRQGGKKRRQVGALHTLRALEAGRADPVPGSGGAAKASPGNPAILQLRDEALREQAKTQVTHSSPAANEEPAPGMAE